MSTVNSSEKRKRAPECILNLSTLMGRNVRNRSDGRPSRTRKISSELRERFVEVYDDEIEKVRLVFITKEGTVRLDVNAVQDELEQQGTYDGMDDAGDVDLDELMVDGDTSPSHSEQDDDDDEDYVDDGDDVEDDDDEDYEDEPEDDEELEEQDGELDDCDDGDSADDDDDYVDDEQ